MNHFGVLGYVEVRGQVVLPWSTVCVQRTVFSRYIWRNCFLKQRHQLMGIDIPEKYLPQFLLPKWVWSPRATAAATFIQPNSRAELRCPFYGCQQAWSLMGGKWTSRTGLTGFWVNLIYWSICCAWMEETFSELWKLFPQVLGSGERVLRASCSVLRGTIETVSSVAMETRDVISQYPRKAAGAWCRRGGGHFLGTGQELWSGVDLRRGNESN